MWLSPFLIIAILFAANYLVVVLYFLVGWLRLGNAAFGIKKEIAGKQPFVSVIVPVRNESDNIQDCLQAIFAQKYPAHLFEVIVVDDYSTDATLRLAREFNRSNLLVLDLQQYLGNPGEYFPNKKKGLALGIKNAQGELIITTDGDCRMDENWLGAMVQYYTTHNFKLITGPVLVKPARNPLAWFQQLDIMNMVAIGGATICNHFPTMCNGANLMYSKKVFYEVEGFKGNHDVPTGDDVFLMHKIDARYPAAIGFVKSFDACVFTKAEKGLPALVAQRVRWVSKSRRFGNVKVALTLAFAYVFNLLILVALIKCFPITETSWWPLAVLGGTKLFVDLVFDIPVAWFFKKILLLLLLPLIEVFHIIYVVIIGALSLTGRYRWKDRLVK
jgi:cellulose synthase/poly-beta-1,6-N-acetylglucosamine synthase-like glycosyltransferase